MFVNGDEVILRKYKEHCVFCDNTESLITFKNKKLCPDCKEVLTGKLFEIIQF
jgi:transcriptional pleiotropic regulator of transition state genes